MNHYAANGVILLAVAVAAAAADIETSRQPAVRRQPVVGTSVGGERESPRAVASPGAEIASPVTEKPVAGVKDAPLDRLSRPGEQPQTTTVRATRAPAGSTTRSPSGQVVEGTTDFTPKPEAPAAMERVPGRGTLEGTTPFAPQPRTAEPTAGRTRTMRGSSVEPAAGQQAEPAPGGRRSIGIRQQTPAASPGRAPSTEPLQGTTHFTPQPRTATPAAGRAPSTDPLEGTTHFTPQPATRGRPDIRPVDAPDQTPGRPIPGKTPTEQRQGTTHFTPLPDSRDESEPRMREHEQPRELKPEERETQSRAVEQQRGGRSKSLANDTAERQEMLSAIKSIFQEVHAAAARGEANEEADRKLAESIHELESVSGLTVVLSEADTGEPDVYTVKEDDSAVGTFDRKKILNEGLLTPEQAEAAYNAGPQTVGRAIIVGMSADDLGLDSETRAAAVWEAIETPPSGDYAETVHNNTVLKSHLAEKAAAEVRDQVDRFVEERTGKPADEVDGETKRRVIRDEVIKGLGAEAFLPRRVIGGGSTLDMDDAEFREAVGDKSQMAAHRALVADALGIPIDKVGPTEFAEFGRQIQDLRIENLTGKPIEELSDVERMQAGSELRNLDELRRREDSRKAADPGATGGSVPGSSGSSGSSLTESGTGHSDPNLPGGGGWDAGGSGSSGGGGTGSAGRGGSSSTPGGSGSGGPPPGSEMHSSALTDSRGNLVGAETGWRDSQGNWYDSDGTPMHPDKAGRMESQYQQGNTRLVKYADSGSGQSSSESGQDNGSGGEGSSGSSDDGQDSSDSDEGGSGGDDSSGSESSSGDETASDTSGGSDAEEDVSLSPGPDGYDSPSAEERQAWYEEGDQLKGEGANKGAPGWGQINPGKEYVGDTGFSEEEERKKQEDLKPVTPPDGDSGRPRPDPRAVSIVHGGFIDSGNIDWGPDHMYGEDRQEVDPRMFDPNDGGGSEHEDPPSSTAVNMPSGAPSDDTTASGEGAGPADFRNQQRASSPVAGAIPQGQDLQAGTIGALAQLDSIHVAQERTSAGSIPVLLIQLKDVPTRAVTVQLSSSNIKWVRVPASVQVPAGTRVVSTPLEVDDNTPEGAQVTLTATLGQSQRETHMKLQSVLPDPLPQYQIKP